MSDDQTPSDFRQRRGARRAAAAYRATRRMAATAVPKRLRRRARRSEAPCRSQPRSQPQPGSRPNPQAEGEDAASTAPDEPGSGYRVRPVRTGFLFGFGFAAGNALFRLILILIFYGALAALGFWLYSRLIGGF